MEQFSFNLYCATFERCNFWRTKFARTHACLRSKISNTTLKYLVLCELWNTSVLHNILKTYFKFLTGISHVDYTALSRHKTWWKDTQRGKASRTHFPALMHKHVVPCRRRKLYKVHKVRERRGKAFICRLVTSAWQMWTRLYVLVSIRQQAHIAIMHRNEKCY